MRAGEDQDGSIELAQLRRLEIVSFAEATTLVVLICFGVPLKHFAGQGAVVQVMGPIHGLVFLAYVWTAIQTVSGGGWTGPEQLRLFAGAMIPFGGFLNLPFLSRKAAGLRRLQARA